VDFDELAEALDRANIRFQRHRAHFVQWVEDEVLLPLVGQEALDFGPTDQRQRTKQLENHKIRQYKVREFVFTDGTMGKALLCEVLLRAKNRMRKLCRDHDGPFVASISRSGDVKLKSL
jgi:hypothetical protein